MAGPSRVILLLEDRRQQQLMTRYLRRIGLWHVTRAVPVPSGKGSGAQWVLERFPFEVAAYRSRASRAATKMIVMIDADTHAVQERIRQLNDSLQRAGVRQIDENGEQIARIVPKRNIETWILCLNLEQADEDIDYKRSRKDWTELIPAAAAALYEWTRPNVSPPASCIPSLRLGITQLVNCGF